MVIVKLTYFAYHILQSGLNCIHLLDMGGNFYGVILEMEPLNIGYLILVI